MKILLILLFLPSICFPQQQDTKLLLYNTGFGGISSAIGAVINKKHENWKNCFVRGFWQGSIGGLINYSSKKTMYLVSNRNSFGYALPARLLSAAGNSIIYNAASNAPFLQNWSLDYGIFRFDLSLQSEKKFKARILPVSVVASAVALSKGKFDFGTTMLTGVMTFKTNEWISTVRKTDAINYGRAIIYLDSAKKYQLVAHEIIHEFQYREYLVFNSFLRPAVLTMKNTGIKKVFEKYIYPDVPYFGLFYIMEGMHLKPQAKNFFEFEAQRFVTNKFVKTD